MNIIAFTHLEGVVRVGVRVIVRVGVWRNNTVYGLGPVAVVVRVIFRVIDAEE